MVAVVPEASPPITQRPSYDPKSTITPEISPGAARPRSTTTSLVFVAVIVNEPDPTTVEDTTTTSSGIDEVPAAAELASANAKPSDASPMINDR